MRIGTKISPLKVLLVATSALAAFPAAVYAQETAQTDGQSSATSAVENSSVGEIVVTAQKRSERINDVPLAIAAMSDDQLKAAGVIDTAGLAKVVPGFTAENSIYGNPVFYIRGVGFSDLTAAVSPTVSVYSDQVPLPYSAMSRGAALDLERVEVLKGPQGTLFGQNSTGGAVNYVAAKPTSSLSAGADLSIGRFNAIDVSGFVSGPITDTLGVRIAGQMQRQDDWQYSTTRDDTRGGKDFYNGRIILEWTPSDTVDFRLTGQAWRDRSDTQTSQFVALFPQSTTGFMTPITELSARIPAPDKNRAADWDPDIPQERDNRFYQIALEGNIDLSDNIKLTSITSYSDMDIYQPTDMDGTDYLDLVIEETARLKSFYQELRLSGDAGPLNWMIGANYGHDTTEDSIFSTNGNTNSVLFGVQFFTVNNIRNNSVDTYAIFGSLDFELTDTLTARGSIRYTESDNNSTGCTADGGPGSNLNAAFEVFTAFFGNPQTIGEGECTTLDRATITPTGFVDDVLKEDNVSWRAGLDWKVTPDTLLYANVAKGYKAGSFSPVPAVFSDQLTPVPQESVLAYEAGVKASLADRRIQANMAAFYYDYKNKQLGGTIDVPPFGHLPALVTVPKSRVYGVEAEVNALITPRLTVRLSGIYLNTRLQEDPIDATDPFGVSALPGEEFFVGEQFPQTPKYQVNFGLQQTFPLSGDVEGYVGGDLSYRSSASAAFGRDRSAMAATLFTLPSYTLLDLRAGVTLNDGMAGFEIWGRNVTDEFYVNSTTLPVDALVRFTGQPRTYGIRAFWRY